MLKLVSLNNNGDCIGCASIDCLQLTCSRYIGSGKTAAFLIPTLSALFNSAKELQKPRPAPYEYRSYKAEPLVLIIAPTRELCSQIFDECRRVSRLLIYPGKSATLLIKFLFTN